MPKLEPALYASPSSDRTRVSNLEVNPPPPRMSFMTSSG